ncbi:MAG: EAL domain-containing protein, partial [Pseudomonadota bacterium]
AAQLRQLAYYDSLTGLPNQKLFRQRLGDALEEATQDGDSVGVLYLDLDRFMRINDTLGHTVGDDVLAAVAARLAQAANGFGVGRCEIGRLSGDEFLVYLRCRDPEARMQRLASELSETLSAPFACGGQDLSITASMGVSLFPQHGKDAEALIKAADIAVSRAKSAGRRCMRMYSRKMSAHAMKRLSLENELRQGLASEQFQLYYQPKYRARDLRIVGAEALIRWFHPTRGSISPGNFIPVAEEAGLIVELGNYVLRAASRQLKAWKDDGLPVVPISVNVSPEEFFRGDPATALADAAEANGISGRLLEVEITESALIRDIERVTDALGDIKKLGSRVSVDDFGTGYSSLAYLKRFPLDRLKIDRSFVNELTATSDDGAICSAIIAMARALGLRVVAEGVETDEQLRYLREQGCDEIQGFLLSRPVPADSFMELVLAQNTATDPSAATMQDVEHVA